MRILKHFLLLSIAVFVTPYIIKGVTVNPFWVAFIVGACLFVINTVIKPIINLLTLPINLLTLGLFGIVINGAIFWLLSKYIPGFVVATFTAAILGALVVSVVNWLGGKIFGDSE
ncbi:MAG: phage holin family protein [bacterium]